MGNAASGSGDAKQNENTTAPKGSLFGAGPSLFGRNAPTTTGGGLFGNSSAAAKPSGGTLFGNNTVASGSLFGNTNGNGGQFPNTSSANGTGLFGGK